MNGTNPGPLDNTPTPIKIPTATGMHISPPIIPPAGASLAASSPPLGGNAAELVPITGPVSAVEAILRQPRRVIYQLKQPNAGSVITSLLLVAVVCSLVYGVIVGTF